MSRGVARIYPSLSLSLLSRARYSPAYTYPLAASLSPPSFLRFFLSPRVYLFAPLFSAITLLSPSICASLHFVLSHPRTFYTHRALFCINISSSYYFFLYYTGARSFIFSLFRLSLRVYIYIFSRKMSLSKKAKGAGGRVNVR